MHMTMNVETAILARHSVRAFSPEPPPAALVEKILTLSAQSASAGNLQPWHVVALAGQPLQDLLAAVKDSAPEETPENASYPPDLWEPLRTRRYENGEALYQSIGIGREEKAKRLEQMAHNRRFFSAPVGIFVHMDKRSLPPQWLDLGIYLQSVMLLAVENGLATCAQGFWRRFQTPVKTFLQLPDNHMVVFGIALGYEDKSAPINQWRSSRAPQNEWLDLRGF